MTTETKRPTAEEQWQEVQDNGVRQASEILSLMEEAQDPETSDERREEIETEVQEWPLSVDVRCTIWRSPGTVDWEPNEFQILLGTGGPALRIIGEFGAYGEPCNPLIQVQDWFRPWTTCDTTDAHDEGLRWFCGHFWFGE